MIYGSKVLANLSHHAFSKEMLLYSTLATNHLAIQEARRSDGPIFNGLQPSKIAARPCAAGTANKSAVP
jgi:hypothetical protein